MTAVVLPGDGGLGPSTCTSKFCKDSRTKNITSMKKMDLLSLFFFDPLHPTFADIYTHKTTPQIITPEPIKPVEALSTHTDASTQTIETNEDNTDPDFSDESLHDEVDTSSNVTDGCECCGGTTCYMELFEDSDTYGYDDMSIWDDERVTGREARSFELADEWESKQRTKGQRNGNQQLRAKRSEKKDKVWAKRYVHAVSLKKHTEKEEAISEHFERQKGNTPKSYVNFGHSNNNRYNSYSNGRDESAEVQRAIALSLSTPPNNVSPAVNVLPCGLSQRQLNDLMNRELTPEDYELLLQLDEAVAKKTVAGSALDRFASRAVTAADVEESACTISLPTLPTPF